MIRTTWRLALAGLLLFAPLSVQAAGISIVGVSSSGADPGFLRNGDVLTVDLVASNPGNLDIFGLGLDVRGYDPDANGVADNGLTLMGGQSTASIFSVAFDTTLGSLGGIPNIRTTPEEKGGPGNPFQGIPPTELHAVMFEGVALSPSNGDGTLDTGIGGALVGDGDVHFRVMFLATTNGLPAPGALVLDFGVHPEFGNVAVGAGGAILPFSNDSLSVFVAPEPGTALLMGLGLAGLATTRRRR
jgi:hypothetical protein